MSAAWRRGRQRRDVVAGCEAVPEIEYQPYLDVKKEVSRSNCATLLRENTFISNVAKLFAGNASSQAILFLSAPIITRLYTPEDLGEMTLVTSIIMVFSVISCWRYERAIMLPEEEEEGTLLLNLCLVLNLLTSLAVFLLVAFFNKEIASLVGEAKIANWLWFVPFGVFCIGVRESLSYWLGRKKSFGLVSLSLVHQAFWAVLVKLLAGFLCGGTALWLIVGNIAGFFSSTLPLLLNSLKTRGGEILAASRKSLWAIAGKYKKFPLYSSWTGLINAFAENIPVFLLSFYFSPLVVGYFALANNMLRKPITLISNSITRVLLEKIARLRSSGQAVDKVFLKTTLGLAGLGVLPFLVVFVYGPQLFSLFFGPQWESAGEYSRILTPWLFMAFIMPPANQIITVFQRLRFNLIFHAVLAGARFAALVAGGTGAKSPETALWLYTAVSVVLGGIYLGVGLAIARDDSRLLAKNI